MNNLGRVVFTGKGIDPLTGKVMTRDKWCNLGNAKGYDCDPKYQVNGSTRLLVASRDDTTKAHKARAQGVKVVSYNQFFQMCKDIHHEPEEFSNEPPPPIDTAGMEEIEGWGMF